MTATSSGSGSRRSALPWWPVVALAGTIVLLGAVDVLPRWAGLVHAVALPPLDLSFDLRVLVARAPSYPLFAFGAFASLAVRSLILAAVLGALGSDEPFRARLVRSARFYVIVWIPVALASGFVFASLAALYHWYFWAGFGALLVTSASLMRMPYQGTMRFPRVLGYLFLLTLLGGLAEATGPWGSVALVPVSAAMTVAALGYRPTRSPEPLGSAVSAVALALASVITAAMVAPFAAVSTAGAQTNPQMEAVLFLVPGVDTSTGHGSLYRFDPGALGFSCDRVFYYSYRGPGPGGPRGDAGCPIRHHAPYGQADTQLPLEQLSKAFARQIAAIREPTDAARVAVVTHSQGNLIAWRAIATGSAPSVSHLITLAGFAENPAPYPARGDDGPGRVGGDILRGLTRLARGLGVGSFDPDGPLARQILATAGGTQAVLSERLPSGVQALTVEATFDAPLFSGDRSVRGARDGGTVDTTHVGLVTSARTAHLIRRFLAGEPEGRATPLAVGLGWITPAFGSPPYGA
jgi:pimeloyl-ACP methyl ester carboxylesterase